MGRVVVVDPADAVTAADRAAERVRRARWIELRIACLYMATDPPMPMPEPLRFALAQAQGRPDGPLRDAAIEAVARAHVGDLVVDRWLATCPTGRRDGRESSS
jgi:hypothetical protein